VPARSRSTSAKGWLVPARDWPLPASESQMSASGWPLSVRGWPTPASCRPEPANRLRRGFSGRWRGVGRISKGAFERHGHRSLSREQLAQQIERVESEQWRPRVAGYPCCADPRPLKRHLRDQRPARRRARTLSFVSLRKEDPLKKSMGLAAALILATLALLPVLVPAGIQCTQCSGNSAP
jgi:hypothetical protein